MAKTRTEERNLEPVYYLALDGDVSAAMQKLASMDVKTLSQAELETRKKYFERFGDSALTKHDRGTTLVTEIKGIFEDYWARVLLQKLKQEDGYHYLFDQLTPIVKRLGGKIGPFSEDEYDRVGTFLTSKLKETGYYAIIGEVKPHLNFMAWKTETTKSYHVDLGDGKAQDVDVVLMDGFESLGWAAYATFDKLHVGGWVGENSLHCVASSYDLESEDFKVSFLAHEARHFADKKIFPKLKSVDLEYRAKLNELMLAKKSLHSLVRKFLLEEKDNPDNPHSYASFFLLKRLSTKLGKPLRLATFEKIDDVLIHENAKRLLEENTAQLNKTDPTKVESVFM